VRAKLANVAKNSEGHSEAHSQGQSAGSTNDADDRADFDLFSLFQGPANVMSGVMGLADNGRKAFSGILDTIASLQRAAAALEQLAARVDRMVTELEAPLRILTPELEKAAERVVRLAEIVEGPMDRLLPGLDRAVETLDRVALSQLPDNIDALRNQVGAVVDIFADIPKRFSGLSQLIPGLDRLSALARPVTSPSPAPLFSDAPSTSEKPKSTTVSKPAAKPSKKDSSKNKLSAKKSDPKKSDTAKSSGKSSGGKKKK
jgi:hypothetical protein